MRGPGQVAVKCHPIRVNTQKKLAVARTSSSAPALPFLICESRPGLPPALYS
jgi:hypothetical protein